MPEIVARLKDVRHAYGDRQALVDIQLEVPAGCMVGLIGPDGVGKSTLLGLLAGARRLQHGALTVLGGDMADGRYRGQVAPASPTCPRGWAATFITA